MRTPDPRRFAVPAACAALLLAAGGAWGSAAKEDKDSDLSADMKAEVASVDKSNLENTLAKAAGQAAQADARLRGLLTYAGADIQAGQARLDAFLRGPHAPPAGDSLEKANDCRDSLTLSAQLLPQKAAAYAAKAAAVAKGGDKESLKAVAAINAKDREADLKRAKDDLKLASDRWGAKELKEPQQQAVDALGDCVAEINSAADTAAQALAIPAAAREKPYAEAVDHLKLRAADVAREGEILRIELLLARYDEDRRLGPAEPVPASR